MSEKTRAVLKTYFETDDQPTQAEMIDFIDSMINILDDGMTGWVKYTLDYTDFQPEILSTGHATILTVPALSIITGFQMKHSTSFAAPTAATISAKLVYSAGAWTYSSILDIKSAVGDTNSLWGLLEGQKGITISAAPTIDIEIVITGDVVDDLTQGVLIVWLKVDQLPS